MLGINKIRISMLLISIMLIGMCAACSFSNSLTNENEPFKYKVTSQDEEWKTFETHAAMVEACRIPSETLNKMTTAEVVDAVIDFPLLFDVFFYGSKEQAVEEMLNNSDAFKELTARRDAKTVLLNKQSYFKERNIPGESLYIKALEILLTEENISQSD
ncbi:hypothetical protein [Sedimentibacter sp.]|uniref:hypothetical protein n=1 Tax=Sedimentibacter sp. TaxID=1960295 RepID=UPI00289AB25C|nr:hypothetical protein [Sedimentibacter sp.]